MLGDLYGMRDGGAGARSVGNSCGGFQLKVFEWWDVLPSTEVCKGRRSLNEEGKPKYL